MSAKISVVRVEPLRRGKRPGVTRYHLSNGWWIEHATRAGAYPWTLWSPGKAKPTDAKLRANAASKKKILQAAQELA
jgi:hypothetical protein